MLLKIIIGILLILYPFGVYFGLQVFEVKTLGVALLGILVIRILASKTSDTKQLLVVTIGGALLAGLIVLTNDELYLKLYPVLVNFLMFVVFLSSLVWPPSAIERLARVREPDLDELGVIYTRQVTMVWCAFFVVNGSIAFWTVVYGSMEQWTLFNGLISYMLIGILMAAEFAVRLWVRKRKDNCDAQ